MFTAPKRPLPFPLSRTLVIEAETPYDEVCGLPEFPLDSDEKITVLFRLSLNEFVALATAVDVGSDIAFGRDWIAVWHLWVSSVMCATFCEEMAACLTSENPAVVDALAQLIQSNQQIINALATANSSAGGGVPSVPLNETQRNQEMLPPSVKPDPETCNLDQLWGGMLYFVQSGNRVITDFFEVLEVASNTLERSEIIAKTIPAAGDYISAAAGFADQLGEELAEAYSGAYTEEYEQQLACDLFCAARNGCELTPDMIMTVINSRLSEPLNIADFGEIMVGVASGVWVGDEVADVCFLIYFSALVFGNQFLDTIGIRPVNVIIALGADQLDSNNWESLCDCPECGIGSTNTIGTAVGDDTTIAPAGECGYSLFDPATQYGQRLACRTFDEPVMYAKISFDVVNQGGGSNDGALARLGDFDGTGGWIGGDYVASGAFVQTGELELTSPVPVTKIWFSLCCTACGGQAIYDNNNCQFTLLDACV